MPTIEFEGHRYRCKNLQEATAKGLYLACRDEYVPDEGETVELSPDNLRSGVELGEKLRQNVRKLSITKRSGFIAVVAEVSPRLLKGLKGMTFPIGRSRNCVALVDAGLSEAEKEVLTHHEVVSHGRHGGNEEVAALDELLTGPNPIASIVSMLGRFG